MSKLPPSSVRLAAAAFVARIVEERFEGRQSRAAKAMGIPQSQLSALLSGSGRGLGLVTLLRVADYAGVAVDAVIGRTPPATGGAQEEAPVSGKRSGQDGSRGPNRIHDNFG